MIMWFGLSGLSFVDERSLGEAILVDFQVVARRYMVFRGMLSYKFVTLSSFTSSRFFGLYEVSPYSRLSCSYVVLSLSIGRSLDLLAHALSYWIRCSLARGGSRLDCRALRSRG